MPSKILGVNIKTKVKTTYSVFTTITNFPFQIPRFNSLNLLTFSLITENAGNQHAAVNFSNTGNERGGEKKARTWISRELDIELNESTWSIANYHEDSFRLRSTAEKSQRLMIPRDY